MADYSEDKRILGLDNLPGSSVASGDGFVVGDASDSGKAKYVLQSEMLTAIGAEPAKGSDDNYVTDAQLVVIGNTSGTNTGDNATNSNYESAKTKAAFLTVTQNVDLDSVESLASSALQAANIVGTITNGDTTHAPSGDAVYDALALKSPLDNPTFTTRINTPEIKATTSAGVDVHSSNGTQVAIFGAGGGANSTFYGGVKMDFSTASTVPYFDTSKNLVSSSVTPTELGYVSGVTSAIQTQIDTKTNKLITANRQTSSYTLVLGDADKIVEMNNASANNLTVPPNSSVAFGTGTQILLSQYGAGQTTVVAGSGVTIRSSGSKLKLTGQYSGATLIKIATDEWYLFGDITT